METNSRALGCMRVMIASRLRLGCGKRKIMSKRAVSICCKASIMWTSIRTQQLMLFYDFLVAAWGLPRISVDFNLNFTCQNKNYEKFFFWFRSEKAKNQPSSPNLHVCLHTLSGRWLFPFTTMIGNYQETIQTGISFRREPRTCWVTVWDFKTRREQLSPEEEKEILMLPYVSPDHKSHLRAC